MSQEGARHRAGLWLAQQVGEKAIKALLAADDRDLRSHSLTHLLRELGPEPAVRWQRQARVLDKLYDPSRYPDALGDDLPADVFGPEDAAAALEATFSRPSTWPLPCGWSRKPLSCRTRKPLSWRSRPLRRMRRPSRTSEPTKSWQVLPSQIK